MNERLKPKRNRQSLIATTVLACVALAYVFFIFLPKQKTIAEMRRELDEKQQFLLQVDRLRYSIQTTDEALILAKNFSRQWEARSPSAATLEDFNEKLSTAADESQVTITKFDPQPVEKLAQICQLPLDIAVEGSFRQLIELLHKIESLDTSIWLESLAIEPLAARPSRNGTRQEGKAEKTQADEVWIQCQMSMKVFADKNKFSD